MFKYFAPVINNNFIIIHKPFIIFLPYHLSPDIVVSGSFFAESNDVSPAVTVYPIFCIFTTDGGSSLFIIWKTNNNPSSARQSSLMVNIYKFGWKEAGQSPDFHSLQIIFCIKIRAGPPSVSLSIDFLLVRRDVAIPCRDYPRCFAFSLADNTSFAFMDRARCICKATLWGSPGITYGRDDTRILF